MEEKQISAPRRVLAFIRESIPLPARIVFCFAAVAAVLHIIASFSVGFADFVNLQLGAAVRFLLAKITGILPFSVAETLILALPVLLILAVVLAVVLPTPQNRRLIASLLAILALFYGLFVFTIGCGYRGSRLDTLLGMERKEVAYDELKGTAEWIAGEINALVPKIPFGADGPSVMPYTYEEMNEKLLASYARLSEEHGFLQNMSTRLKPVTFSVAMSHMHLTGVYTYMTGEANINVDYPDFYVPFTAAHELAHQRGIAREDEANFVAFLVCILSDDPYLQYSGYANLMIYTGNALYSANPDAYTEIYRTYDYAFAYELYAYGKFYEKYENSVVGDISGSINDAYLQIQGTPGRKSYGMVVDLAVAYYRESIEK